MGTFPTKNIRNIALVGHSGCGKTSLSEAMLFDTGVATRLGRVEDGTTVSDWDDEEKRRHVSINTSVIPCEWKGSKINVLDSRVTPILQAMWSRPWPWPMPALSWWMRWPEQKWVLS